MRLSNVGTHNVFFTVEKSMKRFKTRVFKPTIYNSYPSHHVDMKPSMRRKSLFLDPIVFKFIPWTFFSISIDVQYLTVQKEKIVHNSRI